MAPLDSKGILRVTVAGTLLGILAIGLFVILWFGLGEIGFNPFPRMVASVCLPPVLMAGGVAVYILSHMPNKDDANSED